MKKIKAEISARHLHISREHADILFGKDYELTKKKDLSQPGEFAAEERVEVLGSKNTVTMRIVGPIRKRTQIELALSDCRFLGVDPEIRVSGDLDGSPGGVILKGPKGELPLESGVIVPKRHLHLSEKDAKEWGLKNGQIVKAVVGGKRALTYDEIAVRVGKFSTHIHLDTDESNAAGLLACSIIDLDIK